MQSRFLFILVFLFAHLILPRFAFAKTLFVEVSTTKLREDPKFWGKPVRDLSYGDSLEEISREGAWIRVRLENVEGFLHQSAVTQRRVVLKGKGKDTGATAVDSDIVLAGKGFNKEVEAQFAGSNKDLDFTLVDRLEKIVVTEIELKSFIVQGKLNSEGV